MKHEPYMMKCEIWVIPDKKGNDAKVRIYYECDGFACSKLNCGECHLTSNVKFAKKRYLNDEDISRTVLDANNEWGSNSRILDKKGGSKPDLGFERPEIRI